MAEQLVEKTRVEKKRKVASLYQRVFATKQGREVLFDLMKGNFLVDSSPFVPGHPDLTAYNNGAMDLVRNILRILKMNPEQFIELVREETSHVD